MNTQETPAERLQRFIDTNSLVRNDWGDGHSRACLLAALAPETAEQGTADVCPATTMPLWLAYLTPRMDDYGTEAAWPAMIRRYAAAAARWHVLNAPAWERARLRSLHAIVSEARSHVSEVNVDALKVIGDVLQWLDDGAPEDHRDSLWTATQVVDVPTETAAQAVRVARAALECVAAAEEKAAAAAVRAAAWAAAWATEVATLGATKTVRDVAFNAVWDRMTAAILNIIETECTLAEAA